MTVDAYKAAVRLLAASDKTVKMLVLKLTERGFPADEAESAAERLVSEGYIREADHAVRVCDRMYKDGKGPRLILEKLSAMMFSCDAVNAAKSHLGTLDFSSSAKRLYAEYYKKYGDRSRALAALSRNGFDIY